VTRTRLLILALGPLALIGAAYAISRPEAGRSRIEFSARIAQAEKRAARARANEHDVLTEACRVAAAELRSRLPSEYNCLIRTPFVLAGDFSESELDDLDRRAVRPVAEALWRTYFDRRPDQPITIVALRNEDSYRVAARNLDAYEPSAYAGYTQRGERRIVFNAATGAGTLSHELCHVLALFDFPDMPEWFDEGLASLHEETQFSADGLTLTGVPNWRCRLLARALDTPTFPAPTDLIRSHSFRGEGEGLNYAAMRGFCLYLQERGLLTHYYRKFRLAVGDDPSGLHTLSELLGVDSVETIDRDFRTWMSTAADTVQH
jgi:hypothetical protein